MDMVKTITVDGKRFEFVCHSWGTRSGFAHGAEMIDMENYTIMAKAKRFYLNRTWECWDFQSAILDAIEKAKGYREEAIKDRMKEVNGWKKMNGERWAKLHQALGIDPEFSTLTKLYNEVKGNRPAWDY